MAASYVYFLRVVGQDGPVKIGFSRQPQNRFVAFKTWSPVPLEIAAIIEAGPEVEPRFHHRFRHLHMYGEWFRGDPELTATIAAIEAGAFDVSTLPTPRRLASINRPQATPEGRIAIGLRTKLYHCSEKIGLAPPAEVLAAKALIAHPDPAIREPAVAAVLNYIADPVSAGTLLPVQWAAKALADYQARAA